MIEPSEAFIDSMENLAKIETSLEKLIDRLNKYHEEKTPRIEKLSIIADKIEKLEHTFDLVLGKVAQIELDEEEEDLEALTAPEIQPINPYQ